MSAFDIRIFGDPVLTATATEVANIDGALISLTQGMIGAMYEANGLAVAAPQVGVQKRIVAYDLGDGPQVLVNPRIAESDGEWLFDEGCLSIPGLYVEMMRPKTVHLLATDLDGNDIDIEVDELMARMVQHELDHLDGVLMFDRMTDDQRKEAKREWRKLEVERTSGIVVSKKDRAITRLKLK
jgi:peptide deformylase